MDEESDHSCVADITGKPYNCTIIEARMDPQRPYQMVDKDT
jgi:hypothetical protein